MRPVDINHLEVFCAAARSGSLTRAARLLHVTQPAVSAHIRLLEESFGAKLFECHNRGVTLTQIGEVVYEYSLKIIELYEAMERKIDTVRKLPAQSLVVGASHTVGHYVLPCIVWAFSESHPETEIRIEIAGTGEILRQVREGKVELGLVEGPAWFPDLEIMEVPGDVLVLIAPTGYWSNKTTLTLEELKKEPFILPQKGSGLREELEEALRAVGMGFNDLTPVTEMHSHEAIKSAVESGLGISIVPRLTAIREQRRGNLQILAIDGFPAETSFRLVYRPEYQTEIAKRFIKYVRMPVDIP